MERICAHVEAGVRAEEEQREDHVDGRAEVDFEPVALVGRVQRVEQEGAHGPPRRGAEGGALLLDLHLERREATLPAPTSHAI